MPTAFTAWYDDVVPSLPGCPLEVARQKIRQAVIEYCRLSHAWRYLDLVPIDLVANQQTYVIGTTAALGSLPANTIVVHIFQALYNDVPLDVLTPAEFRAKSDTWRTETGDIEAFTMFNEGEISLYRVPASNEADMLKLPDIALAPTQAATDVDDRIYQHARHIIAKGAIAYAMQLPKRPYSDPNYGKALEQEFMAEAGAQGARTASGRAHARLRTRVISR